MTSDFKFRLQHALDADFLIDRELGGGGMSRVFLATERALQRRVVIKVMPPDLAAGVNVERFKREIQLAAQLQHPHVVPLLATGDQDGILWFSMPYIDGESLRAALTREKRLPPRDVVRILHDVVDALAYSHARGIVHRDIKPDNILTSGMHALVTDFGVAKALSAASPMAGGTTTGMAIGTPAYMAPEQLAADPAADHRVDIYAVGLLAYELLTGRSPFGGNSRSPQATMAAQLTETPKPPHQFADIPEALSTLIMHCLEKDSAKRPQSAQALLAELDALPLMQVSGATGAVRRGNRTWVGLAAALLLVAGTYVVAQRVRNAPPGTSIASALFGVPSADTLTARDAGAGGSRTPAMEVARNAAAKSPAVKPETVVVYRNSPDSDAGIQVPVIISRAESLAIVAAYQKRTAVAESIKAAAHAVPASMAAAPAAVGSGASASPLTTSKPLSALNTQTRVVVKANDEVMALDRAQLLAEVGKIFADSVAFALSRIDPNFAKDARAFRFDMSRATGAARSVTPQLAPVSDGRSRVVISNFNNATGKPQFFSVGRDIARYLRSALPPDRFDVVSDEITDRASRGGDNQISLGWGLRSDYVVSGVVTLRGDSVVLVTMFNDVRDPRFSRFNEAAAPLNDPQKAFELSLARVNSWLDTAKVFRSRRGNVPPRPPGGPGGDRP